MAGIFLFTFSNFFLRILTIKVSGNQYINLFETRFRTFCVAIDHTYFIYWIYLRRVPSFKKKNAGILIAITKIDPDADKDILKLYQQLTLLIEKESLTKEVEIKFCSSKNLA